MNGRYMVGINADNREKAKVAGGDMIDVQIELDTGIREIAVPADFEKALARNPDIKKLFESLSYTKRRGVAKMRPNR